MKLIGYWSQQPFSEDNLPVPQELAGELSEPVRSALCTYLNGGELFEHYRGFSWCRFHCGVESKEMGSREFTDGEWVWPEGLSHYVRDHRVVLPEEFIATATSGQTVRVHASGAQATLDFWIEWAGKRKSPAIRERLTELEFTGRAEAGFTSRSLEDEVAELLKSEAEGTEKCVFAGCSHRALVGRRICARHFLPPTSPHQP